MNTTKPSNKTAFTLIELLVVIAIIGLLSTISIIALNQARSKARDARRTADMHQLQTAIEMYYDQYGVYPASSALEDSIDGVFLHDLVTAGFISSDLKDPWNNKYAFYYYYTTDSYGSFYIYCDSSAKAVLRFSLENNDALSGFAKTCTSIQDSARGYGRCICFY